MTKERMFSVNLKIGVFAATAAYFTFGVLDPLIYPPKKVTMENNVINFRDGFNSSSTELAIKKLQEANRYVLDGERVTLTITSEGGSVFDGRAMQEEMLNSEVPVDTYVPIFAASMGADTLMLGKNRYVETYAEILFHGAHAGSYELSQANLNEMVRVLKSSSFAKALKKGKIDPSLPVSERKMQERLLEEVESRGIITVLMETESLRDIIVGINNTMVERIAANVGVAPEKIVKDLFQNFERDVVLTGKQLIDMGYVKNAKELNQK